MTAEITKDRRLLAALVVAVISLVAASCSVADGLLGNEAEGTIESEPVGPATELQANADAESGDQEGALDGAASEEPVPARPSIWTRSNDAAMRPTSPNASLSTILAPEGDRGWTIVGSIFDYDTGTDQPVIWRSDKPSVALDWTRTRMRQLDGSSATMTGAVRAEEFDLAVGSHGSNRDQRPAVWIQTAGEQWRSVDRPQLDRGAQEWLSHVAVNQSNGLIMAVGAQSGAEDKTTPTLWVSTDGEEWEAVEQLPFVDDGTEDLRGLATGSSTSVLTGRQDFGSSQTAVVYWSDDGRTWTKAELDQPTDGGDSYLGEATWFNDQFVAVGGITANGAYRPASWTSSDGKAWALQEPLFELADNGRISSTGFGAMRITATGSQLYATADVSFLQHLWQSTDGINWTAVGDITEFRYQGFQVNSMAASGDQLLLATGEPAIVIHNDGYSEVLGRSELLPRPDEVPWIADLTADGDGFVAAGGASVRLGDGGTTVNARQWRSTDGLEWEQVKRFPQTSTGHVNSIAPWSGEVAAAGTESLRSAEAQRRLGRGLIWQSSGSSWAEIDAPSTTDDVARIGMEAVAAAGDDLLAGGWRFAPNEDSSVDALLVQSNGEDTPERVDIGYQEPASEKLMALCGNDLGEAVALVSIQQSEADGIAALRRNPEREWSDGERLPSPEDTQAYASDCGYGIDGFLAAGLIESSTDQNVGLWRSADGSTWEQVDGPPSFSTNANQWVNAMAVTEAGYLLAGNDASSGEVQPAVWYGSGDDWKQTIIGEAETMYDLKIAFANGTIVVAGWNDGGEQIYSTTLDQLVTELNQ